MELPIGSGLAVTEQGQLVVGAKSTLSSGHIHLDFSIKIADSAALKTTTMRFKVDKLKSLARFVIFTLNNGEGTLDTSILFLNRQCRSVFPLR